MERKGGCCLAPRYGAAAAWQMGRIMLKFRPIAPKPAAMVPAPPAPTPAVDAGRGKRKAVCGAGGRRRGRKHKKAVTAAVVTLTAAPAAAAATQDAGDYGTKMKHCDKEKLWSSSRSSSSSSSGMTSVDSSPPPGPGPQQHQHQLATLLLMPLTPPPVEIVKAAAAAAAAEEPVPVPVPSQVAAAPAAGARPSAPRVTRPAAWVTVEEVTATWRDGEAPPSAAACVGPGAGADDDAPAFVLDQWGRVTWSNAAFARAVSADDGDEAENKPVALGGGALPAWGTCAGFTCRVRVRVRHSSPRRVGSCSSVVVAPCDVWRLDAGGSYLWRLDLQAALTL